MWKHAEDKRVESLAELLAAERERSARVEGALDIAQRQLAIAQNNFEWARLRLNQIEAERSALLSALTKVPIAPMVIERADQIQDDALPQAVGFDFEDVGDDAARRMGIDHDVRGAVKYRN